METIPFEPYYDRDGITIFNADCKEVLPFLGSFDLLLTDPPYGIGENSKKQSSRQGHGLASQRDYGDYDWDQTPPPTALIDSAMKISETAILWGGNYFEVPPSSCWLVWDKDNGKTDFADCELAWTNMKRAVRKFKWKWQGMLQEKAGRHKEHRVHPTQKPEPLMQWCLGLVPDAKTILDPVSYTHLTLPTKRIV